MLLLLSRLIFRGDGDKARAKYRAGSEEAVVTNTDGGEVATDGHVLFHDALRVLFEEGREGRGGGGNLREGGGTKREEKKND